MQSRFHYLIEKINEAEYIASPFRHIEINDFLDADDFNEIMSCPEVATPECASDLELFDTLFSLGYQMVPFPGATTDHVQYIKYRETNRRIYHHSATESAGVVVRLNTPDSEILRELKTFIASDSFNKALAQKFDVKLESCSKDAGIQKYLDGYEISPHPDVRKKALTFMVNINTLERSEENDYHTHYLNFIDERKYVSEYWKGNPLVERCWVPWHWCHSVKQQKANNSMVAFSPSFDTMHAVKASYSHLKGQRTQLYGNLWYREGPEAEFISSPSRLDWWQFDFNPTAEKKYPNSSLINKFLKVVSGSKVDRSRIDNY